MTPAMEAYLRAMGVSTGGAAAGAATDPIISGYQNARLRAMALGLENPEGEDEGGLLRGALRWLDTPRAVIYGLVTEAGNALTGEGFDTARLWDTFERGREGEGFGKAGFLETNEDDPFWERALKFLPAAALDITTDPVNWLTLGTATVPKTAVGQVARSAAKGALDDVVKAAGREAGEGLAREAGESVVSDLAQRQLRYSGGVLDDAITPTLRQGGDEQLRSLATERLADVIGTARIAGTGRTVTAALRQELTDLGFSNADELALQVTRNLPRELRGGLGLDVPFTRIGTSLTRGGGAGTDAVRLGRAADLFNEVRLAGRSRLRGQESLLTKLSGESGQTYGRVLRDIRQQEGNLLDGVNAVLRTPGKASADDLAAVVEANILKRVASGRQVALANTAVEASRRAIADFGDDNSANNIFKAAFHQHNLDEALQGFSRDDARVARLITAADQMRAVFEQAAERRGMRVAGDRDYVPRLVTVDEYNYRKATSPARTSTVGDSDPTKARYAYEELEVLADDEGVMRLVGRELSVPEINAASGRKVFEDDPFTIIARQTDKDVRSIEATEVARVLRERGLLTRDPRTRAKTVGEVQKDVRDAAKKLSRLAPEMSEAATGRASAAAEALRAAQDERTVARAAGATARQNAADAAVQVRQELAETERAWTEANAAVRRLEGQLRRAQAAQDITAKRRAQQQLSRARKKRATVDKDLKNARRRLRNAEKRADAFRDEVREEYIRLAGEQRQAQYARRLVDVPELESIDEYAKATARLAEAQSSGQRTAAIEKEIAAIEELHGAATRGAAQVEEAAQRGLNVTVPAAAADSVEASASYAPLGAGDVVISKPLDWDDPYVAYVRPGFDAPRVLVRGTPIDLADPRIPDVVYHVTPATREVLDDGVLRARGAGGLGGDKSDRIVSMTVSRATAEQLEADIKFAVEYAKVYEAAVRSGDRESAARAAVDFLSERARQEGWVYEFDEFYLGTARSGQEWLSDYFIARRSAVGTANPIIFTDTAVLSKYDIDNIGIIEIPKSNLDNGSLITDFDLGKGVLEEIRSYGDVPVGAGPRTLTDEGAPQMDNVVLRRAEQAEQEVQDFLARTDAANVSRQMLDRVAAERETVETLTESAAGVRQRIDDLTQRLSVLDERIANPTDPATLRAAERLAQFPPEQLDEIDRITAELERFRTDAAYKAQEVAKLKAQRNQLNLDAQRNLPVERQAKLDEKKAADLARRADAAAAAAQGAERELIDSVKRINAIVDEGGWEEASRLFTELARRYRNTGAPKSVRKAVRKGKGAADLLGQYRSQDAVFSRLSAERGLVPLGNEPGRASVPMAFDGWMAGQAISDALDTMYRLSSDGAGLRKALAPYLDPYMRLFKTWATVGRGPGYHVRNFIGGMINNWLLGVRAGAVAPAFRISRAIERTTKAVNDDIAAGKVLPTKAEAEFTKRLKKELGWRVDIAGTSAYDVARGFLAEGVQYSRVNEVIERAVSDRLLGTGTFAQRKAARTLTPETAAAVRRGGDGIADVIGATADSRILSDNPWLRANIWAAEEAERGMRLAAYIEGYGRYGDQVSASLFARSAHFDYQDLTETERSLKMLVPFYTWTRNNIPFQLRQLINRPGSIQRLDAIATNLQAAFGDPDSELMPEWMGRRMGFETPITLPGGGKLALMMESPQLDLFAMLGGEGLNPLRMEEIAESLGPIVRGGFETVTGRDMTSGQEADNLTMLRNLVPPAGQLLRLTGATEQDRERMATSWAGFLTGAPVATITERSRRSEARRRTEKRLSPRIKEALAPYLGEGEEIDGKWLQEVGATRTPEQVLALIEAGYGRKGGPKMDDEVEGLSPALRAFRQASM